jgi:hypothetical protein
MNIILCVRRVLTPAPLALSCVLTLAASLGTAFTFQGRLNDGGSAGNGIYDLRFAIYDAASGGSPLAGPITNSPVGVTNGLFTASLDFGVGVFTGEARWMEIAVRTNGVGGFATFPARQRLTPAPAALYAPTAGSAVSVANNSVTAQGLSTPTPPTAGQVLAFNGTNLAWASPTGAAVSNAWLLGGNTVVDPDTTFLGTLDVCPLVLCVNRFPGLRLDYAVNYVADHEQRSVNVTAGSHLNQVMPGIVGATIAGGGAEEFADSETLYHFNQIESDFGFIGGGTDNRISTNAVGAVVAGGGQNHGVGPWSTVGGGLNNRAGLPGPAGEGFGATVAGGSLNRATHLAATVGGGHSNASTNECATIPGGRYNTAGGCDSFAAGRRAKALHDGVFVWADSTDADFASTRSNQFLIRASGGVGIGTGDPQAALHVVGDTIVGGTNFTAAGHTARLVLGDANHVVRSVYGGGLRFGVWPDANALTVEDNTGNVGVGTASPGFKLHVNGDAGKPGGGSWSVASDARLKQNVQPLRGVLDKLLQLHGVSFEYRDPTAIHELPGQRLGLIAQEVEPVFPDWVETGPDGMKRLTVRGFEALTIEALRQLREEKDARIAALERQNRSLEARLAALEKQLTR